MHMYVFTPSEHGNETTSSLCNKSRLWPRRRAGPGAAPCRRYELRLSPSALQRPLSPHGCPSLAHPRIPLFYAPGHVSQSIAACYKQLLWAAEQSFTLGKVFSHIVKASSYQLLLSSFLGNATWAAQPQPKPLAFKSPSSFSRQNDPAHIPCFFHSSALLQSCIFSHTYFITICAMSIFIHHTFLSTYVHGCSPLSYTVTRAQVTSTASEITVWVKSVIIFCHYCRLVPTKGCSQKCHRALGRALCVGYYTEL